LVWQVRFVTKQETVDSGILQRLDVAAHRLEGGVNLDGLIVTGPTR
jgi:hypothetical protein